MTIESAPVPAASTGSTSERALVRLARFGALLLLALVAACAGGASAARGPFPGFAQYEGRPVGEVSFPGNTRLPVDSLHAVTLVRAPHCKIQFLPGWACFIGRETYELDLQELAGDVLRLQLYYRDHGYYGTRVVPAVEPVPGSETVQVRFAIVPGDLVVLRELTVEGMEGVVPPEEVQRRISLEEGGPFRRIGFLATADTLRSLLHRRGYAYAEILRNYAIDTIADVAEASYVAVPGPLVRVDSIRVLGADRLDRRTILKQMTVREGGVLELPELAASQRNLYQLNIVSFATVEMAPDTLQVDADSTSATVVVRIVEAPKYLADAAAGFGTVDCFRVGTRLVDRNFLGGARTLELSASASRIGSGGLGGTCEREDVDSLQVLNYRLAADFVQPRLLGTRTQLSSSVHFEQQSELSLFIRRSIGGQLQVSREVARNVLVGTGLQVERGSTRATEAIYCVIFLACSREEQQPLRDFRWSNAATLSGVWDRTRQVGTSLQGFQLRSGAAWASPLLGSDDDYLSLTTDLVGYRSIRPGWVLAGRLQGGEFVNGSLGVGEGYIPPERRFYAGGPTSVRGFGINALGPQAYVSPEIVYDDTGVDEDASRLRPYSLGGTRIVLASAELRMPSPVLEQYLRWATFVDAGQVWAPGLDEEPASTRTGRGSLVITPGAGIRITTPVGPIRLDVAYNAYRGRVGPLYEAPEENGQPTGDLFLIVPDYRPEPKKGLFDRLQFHIAVGQAF